ncbi:glycosyltransferase family 4 protein [Aliirhizobium smilacinae]|uniref:Glycosyltransferase family 4 protein n=1 Tax=Aliirhizobium smilacinae TaxID=1395944 RepID=A0A5C4XRZ3_9HYPH|nr:glycosyltransferase family 4 protein [Rhizobium smilacinae]TNM65320.1 glycosyltransferase family 4 protein [Rhizobium smilacinae]
MQVTQISSGRFHHFHLARQLQERGMLKELWTGYPRFKLRDESGIPEEKIKTFPWLQVPYMGWSKLPLIGRSNSLRQRVGWWGREALDWRVQQAINDPTILIALSGQGYKSGRRAKSVGGRYICDRGSTHIRYQDRLLREEHRRWKVEWSGVDPLVIAKEEKEYELADLISIPSTFCETSFVEMGVDPAKLRRIPYGGRLDRFHPVSTPDPQAFTVLFVGQVSLRKGIPYLLDAFSRFQHPRKKLKIVGSIVEGMEPVLASLPTDGVEFVGPLANTELVEAYSSANVLVLPSIEEGLSMVMAEALACGCPVIASRNTGAEDLFEDGKEGFIVPNRDPDAIVQALEKVADLGSLMRPLARQRVQAIGGWDRYGKHWAEVLRPWL